MDDLVLDGNSGGGGAPREQHPTGQYIGVCVDIINLGERVESFQGGPEKLVPKVVFVFMTGLKNTEGELFQLRKEYSFSSGDKSNLRKELGAWRGSPITDEEVKSTIPLKEFFRKPAQLSVSGRMSKKTGHTYSNITGIAPLMEMMRPHVPALPDYQRAEFWEKQKTEYADGVAEFKRKAEVAASIAARMMPPVSNEQAVANVVAAEHAEQDALPVPF